MSGYEDAPATRLLATHCAICGRPLVDAKSVEVGIGPDCRRKHGYDIDVPEANRITANSLVYIVAQAVSFNPDKVAEAVISAVPGLRALGFTVLADTLAERAAVVKIEQEGDRIALATPYRQEVVDAQRAIPGRRWDKERKVNTFPVTAKDQVWDVLKRFFPGALGIGPKGLFVVNGGAL